MVTPTVGDALLYGCVLTHPLAITVTGTATPPSNQLHTFFLTIQMLLPRGGFVDCKCLVGIYFRWNTYRT
ncbi:hypothetical protein M404DRAFT_376991 [Pisolithus tinctorius Marx 270]|uniref:Uncharacterized protein n=1 Tax=Pisolithus tinctorius Marx 270 TaxID=870435 RepID=A0A0C3PIJ7_PISTI|nr:hypothetical protein M404DRAFT_376991 [Pisolithus tinctorius Marx 270]